MSDKLRKSKVRKIENVCLRCRRAVIEGLETPGYSVRSGDTILTGMSQGIVM